jgi:hypothetical protein
MKKNIYPISTYEILYSPQPQFLCSSGNMPDIFFLASGHLLLLLLLPFTLCSFLFLPFQNLLNCDFLCDVFSDYPAENCISLSPEILFQALY